MKKGFTVIEVIVTFVILSILIFFAIYSFRYSVSNVRRAIYYLPKKSIAYSILDRAISGIYFYEIEKKRRIFVEYFQGTQDRLKFITVSPPYVDHISLMQIKYQNNKLILKYEILYQKKSNYNNPKFGNNTKEITLFNQISKLSFSYILRDGSTKTNMSDQIPQGIILKFTRQGKRYHYIFIPMSNFNDNKANIYNENYQI